MWEYVLVPQGLDRSACSASCCGNFGLRWEGEARAGDGSESESRNNSGEGFCSGLEGHEAGHRKELCHTKAGKGIISEDEFTPFIVLNSPVPMHYLKVMGQIDIYPTLLNLLGLEKFRWSGIGQSILDPRKPGIAISPKRKIEGDTLHISADELLRMQQSQVISDRIIRFDKLKDLR